MTQLTINNKIIVVVDVPEERHPYSLLFKIFGSRMGVYWDGFLDDCYELPPGSWQILGRLNEISEEQARELIPEIDGLSCFAFGDYELGYNYGDCLKSLEAFIRSQGITGNPLLLTKTE